MTRKQRRGPPPEPPSPVLPLFPNLSLSGTGPDRLARSIDFPVWTQHKAWLVRSYLYLFLQVTHHGTYLDLFAGPQEPDLPETWAAKLVLELEPPWIKHLFLFEKEPSGVAALEALAAHHRSINPKRSIRVFPGDANEQLLELLRLEAVNKRQAAFCLVDQRTFECRWDTLKALANYRRGSYKIELFYFLAEAWMGRALANTTRDIAQIVAWWGRDDWETLRRRRPSNRADLFAARFRDELGYKYVLPYPILRRDAAGAPIMYFMIHATDHRAAVDFMGRAYRESVRDGPEPPEQSEFWNPEELYTSRPQGPAWPRGR